MARTKTEAALAEAEEQHASDPERAELLARARRFKSSWMELAEALTEVRGRNAWKAWGFPTFEEYTRKELHLRQETVDKLTGSYSFLQTKAPHVLVRPASEPMPSYQSIDFLRRAEEKEGAPEATVAELRRRVIDEAAPVATLNRQYREVLFPLADEERASRDAQQLGQAAKRLIGLLGETQAVTKKLAKEVTQSVEQLIAALGEDQAQE